MTTPEQLAKYRDAAESVWMAEGRTHWVNMSGFDNYLAGYVRAKQEAEQAMKLAKFGAMVMDSKILMYHDSETITDAIACELLVDDAHRGDTVYGISYAPNIEAKIKELLNE